jgi:hypothetical protein
MATRDPAFGTSHRHLDTARAALESLGVVFAEQFKPARRRRQGSVFPSPEGNLLHLVERPHDAGFPR